MKDLLEFLDGIARFLQGLAEFNEVFSWGGKKKTRTNALESRGPQNNTRGGCFLRALGCLTVFALFVLLVLFLIGTFLPPKPNVPPSQPSPVQAKPSPASGTINPRDIKIPTLDR